MFTKKTHWIGVGVVGLSLCLPLAAQAHQDDEAMAFIVGAAVGYAIGDDRDKHRHVHYRSPRYDNHPRHYDRNWRNPAKAHAKMHKRWRRAHYAPRHNPYAHTYRGKAYRDGYRDRNGGHGGGYGRPHRG